MKSRPACPICKVHTTRREVRAAPQMDSLVAIFVSMGSAAGLDIMASQNLPSSGEPTQAPTSKDATSKGRTALTNITNCQKSLQNPKERLKSSDYTFKGAIPAKKRIQVPKPPTLEGELEGDRDDMHSNPHSHLSADMCETTAEGASPRCSSRSKRQNNRKGPLNQLDASKSHPSSSRKINNGAKVQDLLVEPSCSKQVDIGGHGKENETLKEAPTHVQAIPPNSKKGRKRKGKDVEPFPCSQLANNIEKGNDLPTRDDSSRRKLDPFFWLRDESSQETDAIHVTQLTLTQSTVRPNFSDLKDSDDEFGFDANEEITDGIGICGPASYDSDDFDWTQHPCSPELRCSPSKNQHGSKDVVIDIPLEASHPSTKELSLADKNSHKRYSQDKISTKTLLESASKVSSIAQDILDAALKEDKKRKSGRMKARHETHKAVDLPVRDIRTLQSTNPEQQHILNCCFNGPQSEQPICHIVPSEETKQIKANANRKSNAEKPSKLLKRKRVQENYVAGCCIKPQSVDNPPCDSFPLDELKLKPSASSKRNHVKPDKLSKRKRVTESSLGNARNDTVPSKPDNSKDSAEPVCVFCGASNHSQITGSMMHYNQQGTPLAGPGDDGKIIHVHKHCAEWAPDVYFDEDDVRNLPAEAARGLKIKCFSCGKRGAALGCCIKRCRRSYHYPCARALSCKWDEERFIMLCPEHKAEKFPVKKNGGRRASSRAAHNSSKEILSKLPERAGVGLFECIQSTKWVLCGSGLDAAGKNQLATFAKVTGATVSKAWSSNVTHVIAGTDLHGAARRTMKFLRAILEGKWIVKLEWLAACIEAGKPVSEETFEIGTDIHGAIEGPKQGRLLAAGKGPKLFGKLQFYFMPDFLSSYKADLQALVVAGGGGVLHRKPVTCVGDDAGGQRKTIVVHNNENPSSYKKADIGKLMSKRQAEAQELAAFVGANVVPHQWILDSIGSSKVQPLE